MQSVLNIGETTLPIRWRRNSKARRYILRVQRPLCLVATIPRGGSEREAWAFIQRSQSWIERQVAKPTLAETAWTLETPIYFRGQKTVVREILPEEVTARADLRAAFHEHLQALAWEELPSRTRELAAQTNSDVARITIRNQRSRWGSCSIRRTISLNWRLIQTPQFVIDYIILHELMHLRQMNHSAKFWAEVEAVCPRWREAELWIKKHGRELLTT